jgi:hypothetical protein
VHKKAFTPQEVKVPRGALGRPIDVTLQPAGSRIEGQLVAGVGRPVVGGRVSAVGPLSETSMTGRDGHFSITGLMPGSYCVAARVTPGLLGVHWAVPAEASESPAPVMVGPVPSGGTIEVHPPPGLTEVVLVAGRSGPRLLKDLADADADGLCLEGRVPVLTATLTGTTRFDGLLPGVWSVFLLPMEQLAAEGLRGTPQVVQLAPGETRIVE